MDANNLLIWMVGISTVLSAARWFQSSRTRNRAWLGVALLVMLVLGLGLWLAPDRAGYMAFVVWFPLLIAPALLSRLGPRLVAQQRYLAAVWVARLMAVLHPVKSWRNQPKALMTMVLTNRGQNAEAARLLEELGEDDTSMGRTARLQFLRVENRWNDIIDFVETHPRHPIILFNVSAFSLYLRALGEIGRVADMADVYWAFLPEVRNRFGHSLWVIRMFVASLAGRATTVERLTAGPLSYYSRAIKDYWRATAYQAAGRREEAEELLRPGLENPDAMMRKAVQRRLDMPVSLVDEAELSEKSLASLDEIDDELSELENVGTLARPALGRATVTHVLLALQAVIFALEIPGGTTDVVNLINLGALVGPDEYLNGEYWRVITAGFLHFGGLHLALNLFGIWYFGRFLERTLGWQRYLLVYVASGTLALTAIMIWTSAFGSEPYILVGASASLMGIVGASAAVFLRRWIRTRSAVAGRQLGFLALIVLLQTAFDLSTPQVSFAAHFGGVLIGLLFGLMLSDKAEHQET